MLKNTEPTIKNQTAVRRATSMPTHSTFRLPNESKSLKKGKRTTMRHSMPPTWNCFNKQTTPLNSISPQLVQKAHYMKSIWETEISDMSEEMSTGESLEYPNLMGQAHYMRSIWETEISDTSEEMSTGESLEYPNLMGQLHIVTRAGSMDIMNTQVTSPPFSRKEAKGEGPAIQQRESRPSSTNTLQGHLHGRCQTAPQAPFQRQVWKTIRNGFLFFFFLVCNNFFSIFY
jgi:MAP/microtubule affinity-regulating kinase